MFANAEKICDTAAGKSVWEGMQQNALETVLLHSARTPDVFMTRTQVWWWRRRWR